MANNHLDNSVEDLERESSASAEGVEQTLDVESSEKSKRLQRETKARSAGLDPQLADLERERLADIKVKQLVDRTMNVLNQSITSAGSQQIMKEKHAVGGQRLEGLRRQKHSIQEQSAGKRDAVSNLRKTLVDIHVQMQDNRTKRNRLQVEGLDKARRLGHSRQVQYLTRITLLERLETMRTEYEDLRKQSKHMEKNLRGLCWELASLQVMLVGVERDITLLSEY